MSYETVILSADRIFKWDGPKRKQTLVKAKLGRLVLTNERLVFLSTGKNDLSIRRLASGAMGPEAAFTVSKTSSLDLSALTNEGAVDVPVRNLRGAELHGMFKVMTVRWVDDLGTEHVATFAEKNAGMTSGPLWVAHLERLIAQPQAAAAAAPLAAAADPAPVAATAPAGWIADPLGRHELRYWDGTSWTEHVSDQGTQATDPLS